MCNRSARECGDSVPGRRRPKSDEQSVDRMTHVQRLSVSGMLLTSPSIPSGERHASSGWLIFFYSFFSSRTHSQNPINSAFRFDPSQPHAAHTPRSPRLAHPPPIAYEPRSFHPTRHDATTLTHKPIDRPTHATDTGHTPSPLLFDSVPRTAMARRRRQTDSDEETLSQSQEEGPKWERCVGVHVCPD